MIVLDEQVSRENLRLSLKWYPGRVRFVQELRPGTIIKDEAVPALLRRAHQPTFLTINVSDFWLRIPANPRFCILCFPLHIEQFREIPDLLRPVLRVPDFSTKAARMSKVALIRPGRIQFYCAGSTGVSEVRCPLP